MIISSWSIDFLLKGREVKKPFQAYFQTNFQIVKAHQWNLKLKITISDTLVRDPVLNSRVKSEKLFPIHLLKEESLCDLFGSGSL
jgi:hypothetical protein